MVNSKSVKILKNVRLKFVSVILVITTLSCCIYVKDMVGSKKKVTGGFSMMACAGAISWPAFAATAIPVVIMAIVPGSRGVKVAEELTRGGKVAESIAKAVGLAADKALNPNPVELAWTVIDIVVAFTPGGAGMKAAKLALVVPKLISAL